MSDNGNDRFSFFQGFLIGGIFGAMSALLFAPKSGQELRSDIKRRGEEAFEDSKRVYTDSKTKASAILADAIERAQELKDEAAKQLSEARQRAEEILTNAEEKATEMGGSAKGIVSGAKEEVKKTRQKVTKAVEAGVDAARKELGKKSE